MLRTNPPAPTKAPAASGAHASIKALGGELGAGAAAFKEGEEGWGARKDIKTPSGRTGGALAVWVRPWDGAAPGEPSGGRRHGSNHLGSPESPLAFSLSGNYTRFVRHKKASQKLPSCFKGE